MKLGEFVGTRARFQRLRDSKIYNGWIDRMTGNRVVLGLTGPQVPTVGDEYRVEGFGHLVSVVFLARLETIFSAGQVEPATFAHANLPAAPSDVRLGFTVASAVRMSESSETVRYKIQNVPVQVKWGSKVISGTAIDASFTGVGVSCSDSVEAGADVALAIQTPLGPIVVTATCRHCREDADRPGQHLTGFQFNDFGRVDKPKWERFVTNLR